VAPHQSADSRRAGRNAAATRGVSAFERVGTSVFGLGLLAVHLGKHGVRQQVRVATSTLFMKPETIPGLPAICAS